MPLAFVSSFPPLQNRAKYVSPTASVHAASSCTGAVVYAGAEPSGCGGIAVSGAVPADLVVTKKLMTLREGQFKVTDVQGNVMFSVKGSVFSIHDQRVIHDAAGVPILCLRQKVFSAHRRWYVYRGESSNSQDMLFTVKKSSFLQMRTKLDVFLASNPTEEEVPDFHIEGKFMESGCTIYLGNTTTILAQMHRHHSLQSIVFDKDTYGVTVYPNVDYAFIVALIVVLHEINADRSGED